MDELVQLSLRSDSVNDATVNSSTNGDINQSREVHGHGNENDANRLNIQVEETMETLGDVEETPPQPVRPQRQRQPTLRFGYNAPGCPTGEFPFRMNRNLCNRYLWFTLSNALDMSRYTGSI
jgi:hypothetical protein